MITINKKNISIVIVLFIFAFVQGGNLPYYIFYATALVFATSVIFILVQRATLDVEVKSEKDCYSVGDEAELLIIVKSVGFTPWVLVKNEGILKFDSEYKGEVVEVSFSSNRWLRKSINFKKRGIYSFGTSTLIVEDLFGFFKYEKKICRKFEIRVYPKIYDVKRFLSGGRDVINHLNNNIGTGEDIFSSKDVRKYIAGDNLKKIHWKISAKHGELYVKNYDTISGEECCIFLNMSEANKFQDQSGIREENIVDFSVSIISYMLYNYIRSKIFINVKDSMVFEVENQQDFDGVMDFFLKQTSDGTNDFMNFINSRLQELFKCTWIGIITMRIDEDMLNNIMKIKNSRCKITIFYDIQDEKQLEIETALNRIGIECIDINRYIYGTY